MRALCPPDYTLHSRDDGSLAAGLLVRAHHHKPTNNIIAEPHDDERYSQQHLTKNTNDLRREVNRFSLGNESLSLALSLSVCRATLCSPEKILLTTYKRSDECGGGRAEGAATMNEFPTPEESNEPTRASHPPLHRVVAWRAISMHVIIELFISYFICLIHLPPS